MSMKSVYEQVEIFLKKKYDIRYNEISNLFEYKEKEETNWDRLNENSIYRRIRKEKINFSISELISLLKSDYTPIYDPIKKYFKELKSWDAETETDYINALSKYITLSDETERPRFEKQFKKMFVRSVACGLGIDWNKQAFILVHEKQNSGKSTFFRWLAPKSLKNYYTENIGLDKDSLIALAENFLINLDELSTFSKLEINALKSVMSKDMIKVRRPYDKTPVLIQRRCNFVGSTNQLEFLSDETGSIRWVVFEIENINWDYMKHFDINNIWRQANTLFKSGFKYSLDNADIAENEAANMKFITRTAELELLQRNFVKADKNTLYAKFYTSTEIVQQLDIIATGSIKMNKKRVYQALKILGYKQENKWFKEKGFTIKGFYLIPRADKEAKGENEADDMPF